MSDSGFYDNGALSGDGGAIDNGDTRGKGTLHVSGCVFEQNAGRPGRAPSTTGTTATGTLIVARSSFITNVAASGRRRRCRQRRLGGHGNAHITTSTFSGDDTVGNGGAIDNADSETTSRGTTYVSDSTLSDNTADMYGGAIDNGDGGPGTVVLWASTLSDNQANNIYDGFNRRGVDVHNGRYATTWTAADVFDGPCRTDGGTWEDAGYNVGDGVTCLYRGPHDIAHGAGYLVGLGNYGGLTKTELPTSANPAIGAVPLGAKAELDQLQVQLCPTTDQRGNYSPSGQPCDTGATQV